jgi:hypothetical protein
VERDAYIFFFIPQENGILFELDTIARGSSACEFHNE